MAESVKVMVRCRPMSIKEKQRNFANVVEMDQKNKQVFIYRPGERQQAKSFTFDYVFGPQTPQTTIYQQTAFSLVNNVLEGYNGTIFAYGQTGNQLVMEGCGKTFTMMGVPHNEQHRGIIPRTFSQIVTITSAERIKNYMVLCSFIEIYNEQIHDLLSNDIKARMQIKESLQKGIFVKDLTRMRVKTTDEMEKYMDMGFKNRAVRQTEMNKESSRSHSIFTIYIESQEIDEKGIEKFKAGKLNLVDLAGSQRQAKTHATGDGMKQAAKINLSLSALGNVISALVDGKTSHVPYRDSKLTRMLQDSLGGNTKTIMIAALSPADYNYQQSLSTLRYASRAKFIQNKPRINEDPKDAQLREYAEQIKRLKLMLEGKLPLQIKPNGRIDNKQNSSELEQQLKKKELMLTNQKEERSKLIQQLQNLQKIVTKEAPTSTNTAEMQKIQKLSEKLKQQKQKEEEYLDEKRRREEELLNIEKNYRGLNDEVDQMRDRFKDIKKKYVASLTELRDIQIEHQNDKEQLLDTIRYQQKQIKRLTAILNVLMTPEQINQVSDMSEWNEQKRQYIVPPFTYRQKNISFPKLSAQQNHDLLENERKKKDIYFKDAHFDIRRNSNNDVSGNSSPQRGKPPKHPDIGLHLNNIVRGAREGHQMNLNGSNTTRSTSINKQMHLAPIKNTTVNDLDKLKQREISSGFLYQKRRLDPIMRVSADQSIKDFDRYKD